MSIILNLSLSCFDDAALLLCFAITQFHRPLASILCQLWLCLSSPNSYSLVWLPPPTSPPVSPSTCFLLCSATLFPLYLALHFPLPLLFSLCPLAICSSPNVCQFGCNASRHCGDAETGGSWREGATEGRRDRCTKREIAKERWRDIWCSLAGAAMSVVTICKQTHKHTHTCTSTVGKWTQGKSVPSQTEKINTTGNWFCFLCKCDSISIPW